MILSLIYQAVIIIILLTFSFGPAFFALINTGIKFGYRTGSFLAMGVVAFQLVKFTYNFYGSETVSFLDTKIMKDGKQIVIDGDGFTPAGTEIK